MPKMEIDYSNTVIYKITCKDPLITDLYVGHTTNFVQRKHGHKQSCINEKSNNYNCKLYKTIRANGGWNNWVMEIIAFFKCNDHYEARIKEQEYFTSLNATLNSLEPLPKPKPKAIEAQQLNKEIKKVYFCETCNITLQNQQLLEVHNQTKKHCKKTMSVETKNGNNFYCETCDVKCCFMSDWKRHISTRKHLLSHAENKMAINGNKFDEKNVPKCEYCGKVYGTASGLWKHKNKGCNKTGETDNVNNNQVKCNYDITDKELILMLVKQNAELIKETTDFKSIMMKVIENEACNNSHNTTNSHN